MTIKITKSKACIVFWSSLVILFGKCFTCFDKSVKITRKVHGSLLFIMMTCSNGHKNIWRSQPSINRQSLGNILTSSATLFRANTFQRVFDFFCLVGIQCIGKNFRGDIWLVLSKKDIVEKTIQY